MTGTLELLADPEECFEEALVVFDELLDNLPSADSFFIFTGGTLPGVFNELLDGLEVEGVPPTGSFFILTGGT